MGCCAVTPVENRNSLRNRTARGKMSVIGQGNSAETYKNPLVGASLPGWPKPRHENRAALESVSRIKSASIWVCI